MSVDPHWPCHVAFRGYTVLVARQDGSIEGVGWQGLYDHDTRILSTHHVLVGGEAPQYLGSHASSSNLWHLRLRVPRPGGSPEGPALPQDLIALELTRRIGPGMEERWRLENHSALPLVTDLALEVAGDFVDVQEVGSGSPHRGTTRARWDAARRTLTLDHRAIHEGRTLERALRVRVAETDGEVKRGRKGLVFAVTIPPRGTWSARLLYGSLVDGTWREPSDGSPGTLPSGTEVESDPPLLGAAATQAAQDLFALRCLPLEPSADDWFLNAGVPTYTGIFGRDSMTAGWQSALLGPEPLRGALAVLASLQAQEDSPWRDAEPGKIVHEARRGPLAELEITPQRAYYGTQTASAMFVLGLSEAWHWTGDVSLLKLHRDTAMRAIAWAERDGDLDGDGFLEYRKRSPRGLKNQGWKDSDEAIRYPDGSLVENPIAVVEEQAYHAIALERMAEILVALEEDAEAAPLLARARDLKRRWDEAFWVEEDGFYAMALDPDKRPVRSIGSNAGHALGTGIVPKAKAKAVADRLMEKDLFSGWGIRTLSTRHPSYNPYAYHLGTVWPVENATFALGFKRYGLDAHLARLAEGLLSATSHFRLWRLPEALGGHDREEAGVPTVYPGSNSPQAWSASAVVQLVQILLGLYAFAPARVLALVRPRLPAFLRAVVVRNLRVGDAVVSLRFERREDGITVHDVIERSGTLFVVHVPPPDDVSEGASVSDLLRDFVLEHAPGRLGRALRIALGRIEEER